jgi:3-phosphoshikimate 1-carboxyvinyltransferase
LLASLYASGVSKVAEPWLSRDHTERMMSYFGIPIAKGDGWVAIGPVTEEPRGRHIAIPGDLSSAAFPIAVAACSPGSILRVENVGVNPTRTGFFDVLRAMGATVELEKEREVCGEPVADVVVEGTELRGVTVAGGMIPRLIDEIPILAVVAAKAKGRTVVRDARELRVKETDRIQELGAALGELGVVVETRDDGLVIDGPQEIRGGAVSSRGDHRLALALACAGLLAKQPVIVTGFDCADVSFPGFIDVLTDLGLQVEVA